MEFNMFDMTGKIIYQTNTLHSEILAINLKDTKPIMTIMKWAINWNPKMPIYNSRVETIRDQPRWKSIFNKSRCLIPATSFYEYRPFENDPPDVTKLKKENKVKRKTKFNIAVKGEEFFFIGGIYVWNKDMNYCSMITTPPHKDLQIIPHHRSPYIILIDEALEFLEGDPAYLLDNIKLFDEVLEESGLERSCEITAATRLRADLDLDSLDLAVLTVKLEAKTGVDVFAKGIVTTVGEILCRIDGR